MNTSFPVTITTAEEFRLFEQENREALLRRCALSLESDHIGAPGVRISLKESRRALSIPRTVGVVSVAISLVAIGIAVMRRRMLRRF
jgi:hypothetical protein